MIGLFGYMTGYDGTFPFESPGQKYNETRYIGMRIVSPRIKLLVQDMFTGLHANFNFNLVLHRLGFTPSANVVLDRVGNDRVFHSRGDGCIPHSVRCRAPDPFAVHPVGSNSVVFHQRFCVRVFQILLLQKPVCGILEMDKNSRVFMSSATDNMIMPFVPVHLRSSGGLG